MNQFKHPPHLPADFHRKFSSAKHREFLDGSPDKDYLASKGQFNLLHWHYCTHFTPLIFWIETSDIIISKTNKQKKQDQYLFHQLELSLVFLTALDGVRQKDNGAVHHLPWHSWSYTNTKLRCQSQIKMSVSGAALASVPFFQEFPQPQQNVIYPWSHPGAMPRHSSRRIPSHWERSWWWKGSRASKEQIPPFIIRFPFSYWAHAWHTLAALLSLLEITDFSTKGGANRAKWGRIHKQQVREVFGIKREGQICFKLVPIKHF